MEFVRTLLDHVGARMRTDRLPQVAASLTFTSVLALVPMITVAFALLTAFPVFQSFQKSLQAWMFESLVPEGISSQVLKYVNQFSSKAKGLTAFGLLGLAVTTITTLVTIENAFNAIWRVRRRRPLAQRLLIFWATITVGPVLIGASLSLGTYLLPSTTGRPHLLLGLLLDLVSIGFSTLAFSALYAYVPNAPVARRDAVAGGLVAAVVFELAKTGFGVFVSHFPTYTAVYGAFAAVPIFLLWIYLCWLITLCGAMITACLPMARQGIPYRDAFPGAPFFDALGVLLLLAEARAATARGLGEVALARELQIWPEELAPLLEQLKSLHLIGRLERSADEHGGPLWVLVCEPAQVRLSTLVETFAFDVGALPRTVVARRLNQRVALLAGAIDNPRLEITLDQLFH